MYFGDSIRYLRAKLGIKQRELFHNYCSREEIYRIENNRYNPSVEMLFHISSVLGVSPEIIYQMSMDGMELFLLFEEIDYALLNFNYDQIEEKLLLISRNFEMDKMRMESYLIYNYYCAVNSLINCRNIREGVELLDMVLEELSEKGIFPNYQIYLRKLIQFICSEEVHIDDRELLISQEVSTKILIIKLLQEYMMAEKQNANLNYYLEQLLECQNVRLNKSFLILLSILGIIHDNGMLDIVKYISKNECCEVIEEIKEIDLFYALKIIISY